MRRGDDDARMDQRPRAIVRGAGVVRVDFDDLQVTDGRIRVREGPFRERFGAGSNGFVGIDDIARAAG